jgi:hypothetical protein
MSVKYSKWALNKSTFSNLRLSKIYPIWDFWFENKPSGNPGCTQSAAKKLSNIRKLFFVVVFNLFCSPEVFAVKITFIKK